MTFEDAFYAWEHGYQGRRPMGLRPNQIELMRAMLKSAFDHGARFGIEMHAADPAAADEYARS